MLYKTIYGGKGEVQAWIYKEGREFTVIGSSGETLGYATEGSGTYDADGRMVSTDCAPSILV